VFFFLPVCVVLLVFFGNMPHNKGGEAITPTQTPEETMDINQITFGVELEMSNISMLRALTATQKALQTCGVFSHRDRTYRAGLRDNAGRLWKVVSDCTTTGGCEVVTPICTLPDMPVVQEVLRELVRHGATPDGGAGLHCHIGMQNWSNKQFNNLIKFSRKYERLMVAMAGTTAQRERHWCAPMTQDIVDSAINGGSMEDARDIQAGRYYGVNLQSLHTHGTVEFRFLEAVSHAGKLRAQVMLILMVAHYCANAKRISAKERDVRGNTKYAARALMKQIGMVGDTHATVRKHILANLEGDSVLNRIDHHGYESWTAGIATRQVSRVA